MISLSASLSLQPTASSPPVCHLAPGSLAWSHSYKPWHSFYSLHFFLLSLTWSLSPTPFCSPPPLLSLSLSHLTSVFFLPTLSAFHSSHRLLVDATPSAHTPPHPRRRTPPLELKLRRHRRYRKYPITKDYDCPSSSYLFARGCSSTAPRLLACPSDALLCSQSPICLGARRVLNS